MPKVITVQEGVEPTDQAFSVDISGQRTGNTIDKLIRKLGKPNKKIQMAGGIRLIYTFADL